IFGGLGSRSGLVLFDFLGAFSRQSGLLILGLPGLFRSRSASLLGDNLARLALGKVGVEAAGVAVDEGGPHVAGADLERQFIVAPDFAVRVCLRTGCCRLGRYQRNVISSERAVHIRLLLVAGGLE